MDLFTNPLPQTITVNGKDFPIATDFRVWVRFDCLTERKTMGPDTLAEVLALVFPERVLPERVLPDSLSETLSALFRFYACGEDGNKKRKSTPRSQKRVVSFSHDSPLIYAAFLAQYGIDLTRENLHWWKFRALFDGLNEHQKICEVVGWRAADLSKIKDKERRAFYRKMQEIYKLPDTRSIDEIEQDNIKCLAAFF